MKIKRPENTKITLIPIGVIILVLLTISLKVKINKRNNSQTITTSSIHDTSVTTTVIKEYGILDMLKENINVIHSDPEFTIHFNKINSIPKIYYVYKDSLTPRQLNDKFFIHVFPKNKQDLLKVNPYNYINMDFTDIDPEEYTINNEKYYVFQREFTHESLGKFIEVDNIDFFNTGRYEPTLGRSYQVFNVKFDILSNNKSTNIFEKLTITIDQKDFDKIKNRRNEALKSRVLAKKDDDFVKSFISFNSSDKIVSKIRLKGDWTDHLQDEKKWSFRVILEEDKTVKGMKKFSIQHPKVRNNEWEWLFNKVIKRNGLIGLRYDFINVDLKITKNNSSKLIPIGIMGFEESFDKHLIENNKRREGIILSFHESFLWEDRKKSFDLGLNIKTWNQKLQKAKNLPIKVFDESRVLSDPKLSKQLNIAKDLLNGIKKGELKISEAFDIDKLTMFVALSNLFGGHHGLIDHNLRIYFNPITNKLEPIAFDSHGGFRIDKIINYPFSDNDPIYKQKLLEKLELISSQKFIKNFVDEFYKDLNLISASLKTELKTYTNLSVLDYNSNFIKKQIDPANTIISNLVQFDENKIQLAISNITNFPIVIKNLEHIDGKILNKPFSSSQIISPQEKQLITFDLKNSFDNAFVSKKNKKGGFRFPKDVKKLKIKHKLQGVSFYNKSAIIPYGSTNKKLKNNIISYKKSSSSNYSDFGFIKTNQNQIILPKGNYQVNKTLFIPANHKVIIEKGVSLDLINNASIISYSPIIAEGTKELPITIFSSNNSGAGVFVSSSKTKSILQFCEFINLSNPNSDVWDLSGAVNFHETDVQISHSTFRNNRCEDGLNIIRSNFSINHSSFENTFSDAFDGDFVEGSIQNTIFTNNGNDGIDISGSSIFINNIEIKNSSDKAISAGESSTITGKDIVISGGEIGIVSKDLSKISLQDVHISNTRLGLSSFQKKPEYGTGSIDISKLILKNNELDHLIENGSQLLVDNIAAQTVSDKVIDQMYGKEYGKSSK
ncbi:hypothetical protein [Aquimarina sp. AU474]|uniref:hypothetical protein n=1 Tax=Aquimarina sp. AU474 TaxID=2108529 RepID=UPI000D68B286|nr:hypothetical protein [Aquimarina sp. AU474]